MISTLGNYVLMKYMCTLQNILQNNTLAFAKLKSTFYLLFVLYFQKMVKGIANNRKYEINSRKKIRYLCLTNLYLSLALLCYCRDRF